MIGSKTAATQWERSVKRMWALGCAVVGVAVFSSSCSSPTTPPKGFVNAVIQASPTAPGACSFPSGEAWVTAGTDETSVPTGTMDISVTCTVSPSGGGFSVQGNITVNSSPQQSFTITGTMSNSTAMPSAGITATFSRMAGSYTGAGCTVNFNSLPSEPLAMDCAGNNCMGVYPGRVWGNLTCPTMDAEFGGTSVCEGTAEFKFEDCSE